MLKTKPLNALLSQSLSEHVSSAILFTPSGNLLASAAAPNSPDAKKARVHAALAANIWSSYERVAIEGFIREALPARPTDTEPGSSTAAASQASVAATPPSGSSRSPGPGPKDGIKTLTVELSDYNLHIQSVSPRILLGLIGRRPGHGQPSSGSSQHSNEPVDPDAGVGPSKGAATGPSHRPSAPGVPGPTSTAGSGGAIGGGAMGILKVTSQTLVDYLRKELKDFEPPDDL